MASGHCSRRMGSGRRNDISSRVGIYPDGQEGPSLPFIFDDVFGFSLVGSQHFDALIGMDILSQCEFSLDRQGMCRLSFG
jgi:hypothetical protein